MMKNMLLICAALLLTHCASAPKAVHCKDDGKGLKPVNAQTAQSSTKIISKADHD